MLAWGKGGDPFTPGGKRVGNANKGKKGRMYFNFGKESPGHRDSEISLSGAEEKRGRHHHGLQKGDAVLQQAEGRGKPRVLYHKEKTEGAVRLGKCRAQLNSRKKKPPYQEKGMIIMKIFLLRVRGFKNKSKRERLLPLNLLKGGETLFLFEKEDILSPAERSSSLPHRRKNVVSQLHWGKKKKDPDKAIA